MSRFFTRGPLPPVFRFPMKWMFEKFNAPDFIRIVSSGQFTSLDFSAMFDELIALPYWNWGVPLLFDQRNLEATMPSSREMLDASDTFIRHNTDFAYTKISILYRTVESYERGLKFAAITRSGTKALVKMFRDETKAMNWILPPPLGPEIHSMQRSRRL